MPCGSEPAPPGAPVPALPWGDLERELRHTPPEGWLRLGAEVGVNALAQRRILIGRFAGATELQQALAHADPGSNAETSAALADWRREADRYVPGLPQRAQPCRRHSLEGPDLQLDLHCGAAPGERPVVVGLTGDWGMLMSPVAYMVEALQRQGLDLLLVRRRWRGGYFGGGQGDWLRQIGVGMAHISGRRIRPRAVLGTSSGGLPALVLAERLGARSGVAIGASTDAGLFTRGGPVRRWRRWHRIGRWLGRPSRLLLVHGAEHPADREAAFRIVQQYGGLRLAPARLELRPVAGGTEHNAVQTLVQRGQPLPELLAEWLGDSWAIRGDQGVG